MKSVCSQLFLIVVLCLLPACADTGYVTSTHVSAPPAGPVPDTLMITRLRGIASLPPYDKMFHNQAQIEKLYQDMWNSISMSDYVCNDDYITYTLTFLHGNTQIQQVTAEYGTANPPYAAGSCAVVIFHQTDLRYAPDAFWTDLHAIIQLPLAP